MPPPPPSVAELDDELLDELYDHGAVTRGWGYAAENRVRIVSSEPGLIRSVCQGSGRATYIVRVGWHRAGGGGVYVDDECSCPLGGECKHCVATILTARAAARRSGASSGRIPAAPRPDWRSKLAGLAGDVTEPELVPLALQFQRTIPHQTRYGAQRAEVLTIRPMRMGKQGKWVKTGASWTDLVSPYARNTADLDPRQLNALRGLANSARLTYYAAGSSLSLDQFGPDLCHQLELAVAAGVRLIGGSTTTRVDLLAESARPRIDLTASPDGTLKVAADIVVAGRPIGDLGQHVAMIGSPCHAMWVDDHGHLTLVGFDAPLHPAVANLIGTGPLSVPARDIDELLDLYVPAFARHGTVGSSDGSVTVETSQFHRLLLTIHRTALDVAEVRWSARYRRGERTADHPLSRPATRARDLDAERQALAGLTLPTDLLPQLADHLGRPRDVRVSGHDAIVLLTEVVPWFETTAAIDIEIVGDLPTLRAATEDPLISLAVRDGANARDGHDWFDLDVTVSVDGEDIDFVSLFTALHQGDEALILPSGTWLRLDRPEFTKLRELLDEARGLLEPGTDSAARVNRFQADWWAELADLGVVAEQSERWAHAIDQMAALSSPEPIAPPVGLDATLRPYQQEGLDWLAFLHRNELGGILADDMGLGKTVQTLALCLHVLGQRPDARFLVVAPTSVVDNWAREAARFAPGLSVRTIIQTQARRGTPLAEAIDGAQLVVTSYALFRLEIEQYEEHAWELLLLDEAQFVKNHQGKTYQCARRLPAATKIAITGTPLENTLMDLWALLSIGAPGLYPDPKRFSETYRKPIESGDAPELLATLRRRIAPLMRRRTKDAVLTELPPKTEQTIEVEMSARHARIYATQLQRQRQRVLGLVGDVTRHRFEILKSLTLLRQLALDPGLVDEENDHVGSAKLDRLVEDLTQIVAEGHRALVFSQFTRYLARVRTRLDDAGIDHAYLDGRKRDRAAAIAQFKDGGCPVFVISLKAGGFGLNLTEADYCFVLDPWWNPATETQAVDRAHRIGQPNPVVVYRYVSANTIEEKVMALKERKANLFDRVIGDDEGGLAGALNEDDIRSLLDLS